MGYQPSPRRFRILVNHPKEMQKTAEKFGMSLEELKARVFSKEKLGMEEAEVDDILEATRADRILHEFCKMEWSGPELLEADVPLPTYELMME